MIFDKSAERRASKSGSPELPASFQGVKGPSSSCPTVPFSKFTSEQPPKQVGLQRAQAHQQRPADQPQRDQHDQYGQPQEPFVDPPYASLARTIPIGSARLWGLCYSNGSSGSKVSNTHRFWAGARTTFENHSRTSQYSSTFLGNSLHNLR
jgi:hypothetical protein